MSCSYCRQKTEWFNEKLKAIRDEAKQHAKEVQITQAIYKEGCLYRYCDATGIAGKTVIEFVSAYN